MAPPTSPSKSLRKSKSLYALAEETSSQTIVPQPEGGRKISPSPAAGLTAAEFPKPEHGLWTCCQCEEQHNILLRAGRHPIGAVACQCPHKPCEECTFSGCMRYFLPITDPLTVPVENENDGTSKEVPYGIICRSCGLSWRAEELRQQQQRERKAPNMKDVFKDLHKKSLVPRKGKLQKSQSLMNLVTTTDTAKEPVQPTLVKFSGLKCTCGSWSTPETFCFRIVTERELGTLIEEMNPASPTDQEQQTEQQTTEQTQEQTEQPTIPTGEPSRATNEELRARGHQLPMLCVRNVVHANPLRSNPVKPSDLL